LGQSRDVQRQGSQGPAANRPGCAGTDVAIDRHDSATTDTVAVTVEAGGIEADSAASIKAAELNALWLCHIFSRCNKIGNWRLLAHYDNSCRSHSSFRAEMSLDCRIMTVVRSQITHPCP